jgi:glycine hydroxymethyltransferase
MNILKNDSEYTNFLLNEFEKSDEEVFRFLKKELTRQKNQIELIASENFVSNEVLCALGSIFTNKYAEGYPGSRYYGGCENMDEVEKIAINRICKLFNCNFANVQPHSGVSANTAAFYAFLKPGDSFLGMDLASGGHLTHGAKPTLSGKWFNAISYNVDKLTHLIDYEEVRRLAIENKPKLIIAGASSYSRNIDFKKFREICDEINAILMADVSHYSGLIVADEYNSPFPYADIVTSTTHKTLRGPRGAVILWNKEEYSKKINSAVFPGTQGGPLMNVILAKAIAFGECLKPEFKIYAYNVKKNAKLLSDILKSFGFKIISDGTESHMLSVNIFDKFNISGAEAEKILENIGITCNKNAIPFDKLNVKDASGIRLGTAAITTLGYEEYDIKKIGEIIYFILNEQSNIKNLTGSIDLSKDLKINIQASNMTKNIISKKNNML